MILQEVGDPAEILGEFWRGIGGQVGWDVGANIGQAMPEMTARFKKVYAFEPCLESYRHLARRWESNPQVTLFSVALTDHRGRLNMHEREECLKSGQLTSEDCNGTGLPWGPVVGLRLVACSTVDWYAHQYGIPDFITVDTEGHEAAILRGATETLTHPHVQWLIEFHSANTFAECEDVLLQHGYVLSVIRHPHYKKNSVQWKGHGWIKTMGSARNQAVPVTEENATT
jgi:FkbM family methyltransferase